MKPKKCKVCPNTFTPRTSTQIVCSWSCAAAHTAKLAEKRKKTEETRKRKELKEAKEKLITISDMIKQVDAVYNPYIRLRDELKDLPCPSCGRYDHEIPNTYYGKWDCGHYLSKGSHPELRYEELNTWRQCKSCNGGSGNFVRKNHEVQKYYRITLIERIGLEKVEWLEGPHEPKKYTVPELQEIKRIYKEKLKLLKE